VQSAARDNCCVGRLSADLSRLHPVYGPGILSMVSGEPLHDPEAVLDHIDEWFEGYNKNHLHSGHRMRSPREFRNTHRPAALSG
jgi:transposase InsO family protein